MKAALQNPGELTDAKGRFSLTVARALFTDKQEFVVVVPLFDGTVQPMRPAGGVVTIKIDKTTKEYKLGTFARDNPAIR